MVYTLGEAAKATGKTKGAISKAIKKGRISADREKDGSYHIDPAELHRVYPPVSGTQDSKLYTSTPIEAEKIIRIRELEIELTAMNKQTDLLQEQIMDLKSDKVFLQSELQKATLLLASPQRKPGASKSFWRSLFGKG